MPISPYIANLRQKVGNDLLMLPAAAAIIFNDEGHILLQLRGDNQLWGLPGGALEPGEEPAATAIREALEETGLHIRPTAISGVYGGSIVTYPNGDQVCIMSVTFRCEVIGGELHCDGDETLALRYFPPDALPPNVMPHHLPRIQHATTRATPYF